MKRLFLLPLLLHFCLAQTTSPPLLTLEELQQLDRTTQQLHETLKDAVVAIKLVDAQGRDRATGSGTLISKDGHILTCYHVIAEIDALRRLEKEKETPKQPLPEVRAIIILPDGRELPAQLLGCNRNIDLAMLQLEELPKLFTVAKVSKAKRLKTLDWVLAMGHSEGYKPTRPAPLRLGSILSDDFDSAFITTDCAIIAGDSGGPLFDLKGELVGVHSFISDDVRHNRHVNGQEVYRYLKDLKKGKRWGSLDQGLAVDEPFIGIVNDPRSSILIRGVLIAEVAEKSPADKAGLQPNDIITQVNETPTPDLRTLQTLIRAYPIGTKFKMYFSRDGEENQTTLKSLRRTDIYYEPSR